MFKKPITVTDLYGGSLLLSLLLVQLTVMVVPNSIVTLLALVLPPSFVTARLVFLSEEYDEESLLSLNQTVYASYIGASVIFTILISILTYYVTPVFWTVILFLFTLCPFVLLDKYIGKQYSRIDFGFRSALPKSEYWESGTVCIQNGRKASRPVLKSFWYLLASGRFCTLTNKLNPEKKYSNHHIASAYCTTTRNLAKKNIPLFSDKQRIYESELDSILVELTQQECRRCGKQKPISKMYVLTTDDIISDIYCELCIEEQNEAAKSQYDARTETEDRQEAKDSQETKRKDSQSKREKMPPKMRNSLQVFDMTYSELQTSTEAELREKYRSLVQEKHPDTGGDAEEFKTVVDAYEYLQEEV